MNNTALALHTIEREPRVLDTDLAERLGYAVPRKIRQHLIEANREELETMGILRTHSVQSGGRPSTAFYLNEEQALLICMFSRTEKAAVVRKQVIETFMSVRRGTLAPALPNFSDPVAAARAWANEFEAKQIAQAQVEELKPLAIVGSRAVAHNHNISRFVRTLPGVNTMKVHLTDWGYNTTKIRGGNRIEGNARIPPYTHGRTE